MVSVLHQLSGQTFVALTSCKPASVRKRKLPTSVNRSQQGSETSAPAIIDVSFSRESPFVRHPLAHTKAEVAKPGRTLTAIDLLSDVLSA